MTSRLLLGFFFVLLTSAAWAQEPVPLTIWQSEKRFQPENGTTVSLNRRPFRFLFPLGQEEVLSLAGGEGEVPEGLAAFEPGRGLAGPYDGFFLDWEAHHHFYYDPSDPKDRVDLWDRDAGKTTWVVERFYHRTGDGVEELDWSEVPDLHLVVRKDGYEELRFRIKWRN